jgi:hypothetical protein
MAASVHPRRARRLLARLSAVALGVIFALLLVEVGFRVLYGSLPPAIQIVTRFVRVHPFTDTRLAPLPLWESDRDYQTILRPGARDTVQIGSMSVRFSLSTYNWWGGRVGFRSPQPETGRVEGVALGDSHTTCFVDEQDCWVNILNAQLGLALSNLGQPTTGSLSHARLYWDFVAKPELGLGQPELVIWQFFGNDYNDDYGLALLNNEARTPPPDDALTEYFTDPYTSAFDRWLSEQSAIYALLTAPGRTSGRQAQMLVDPFRAEVGGEVMYFGRSYITESFDMRAPRNQEGEAISRDAILRTRDIVRGNSGQFVIVLLPAKEEVYRTVTEPYMGAETLDALAEPRERLMAFCAAQGIACFDATPALQAIASTGVHLFWPDDLHLNAEGNRVLAAAIASYLAEQGIVER